MMSSVDALHARIGRLQKLALPIALVALAATIFGWTREPALGYRAYLVAFLFVLMVPAGSLALTMVHALTGGYWGLAGRRVFQSAARTLPIVALMFIPIAIGMNRDMIYPWTDEAAVAADHHLHHKAKYLNEPFWLGRAIGFFVLWCVMAFGLISMMDRHERSRDADYGRRVRVLSGIGLLLFCLTMNFAAVDWAMSLEPKWFSTIYGVIMIIGQGLATWAFVIITLAWLSKEAPYSRWITPDRFHDLGKLMFAFVLLFAYTNLSQFLIIWSGNLPEETPWYMARMNHGWDLLGLSLVLLHFALPFLLLLWRPLKRNPRLLVPVAMLLFAMRFFEINWLVIPAFEPLRFELHWMNFTAPIGLFALWLWLFAGQLKSRVHLAVDEIAVERGLEVAGHAHA